MYYLRSRYYDPEVCRFINADSFASTGQGIIGYNMFAYCRNNPIGRKDADGAEDESAIDKAKEALLSLLELLSLLNDNTTIDEKGFTINIETAIDEWDSCIKALGTHKAYDAMAGYLCGKYKEIYDKEFLFSESCVAYEIEYHVDAFMWVNKKKGYTRNVTTFLYSQEELYEHCKKINISTNDLFDFKQKNMFGYKNGIRECYIGTEMDPYDRRTIWEIIGDWLGVK